MGMWIAYHDVYEDAEETEKAMLHVEKTGSRILLKRTMNLKLC